MEKLNAEVSGLAKTVSQVQQAQAQMLTTLRSIEAQQQVLAEWAKSMPAPASATRAVEAEEVEAAHRSRWPRAPFGDGRAVRGSNPYQP